MISQTTEYALRAVIFLSANQQGPLSRTVIASATQVPAEYLTKVLQELDRAGLVVAQRGPGGGYQLNLDPNVLTVYDVVAAISALPRIKKCPLNLDEHAALCPLHKRLDDAAAQVEKAFRETTIAELAPGAKPYTACQFPN